MVVERNGRTKSKDRVGKKGREMEWMRLEKGTPMQLTLVDRTEAMSHNHIGGRTWKRRSRLLYHGTTSTPRSEPIQNTVIPQYQESRSKSSLTSAYLRRM